MLSHAALCYLEVAGVAFGRTLRVCSLRPAYEPCRAHRVRFSSLIATRALRFDSR